MIRTLGSAFLVLLGFGMVAHADLACHLCEETIEGRYVEYKGHGRYLRVCAACNRSQPKCNACRVPQRSNDLTLQKSERLCSICLAKAKYCSMCDHRIQGQYYEIRDGEEESSLFCRRCYVYSRKCTVCRTPVARNEVDPRSGACADCLPNLPTCTSCSSRITGTYFEYQFSDGQYCSRCKQTKPECYVCNVPVGAKFWKFPDGRTICSQCNERTISDPERIRSIVSEVEDRLETRWGMVIERPYTLHIERLSRTSFGARKAKSGESAHSPLFGRELGLYRYSKGKSEIFLLYGLPEELVYETAAHELAHAWQMENCPPDQSLNLKEGFAQWVSAQLLRDKGYTKALAKLESRTDYPYGTGYRRIKTIERRHGTNGVLRYVKSNRQ